MFDWRDFLELGRTLGSGASGTTVSVRLSEATMRAAVGRAYYAAFGHARSYATWHLGFASSGTAADHGRLTTHFRVSGMPLVAQYLGQLRTMRNQCDYDTAVPALPAMVSLALRNSAAVIHRL
jgi:hypothetical protein